MNGHRNAVAATIAICLSVVATGSTFAADGSLYLPWVHTPRVPRVTRVTADPPRGLHAAPLHVALHTNTSDATIYFTLDGSSPRARADARTDAGVGGSTADEGSDVVFEYARPVLVAQTTVIRAFARRRGWLDSEVGTWTFILPAAVAHQPPLPPGWPSTWGRYQESHLQGQFVAADYAVDPRVARTETEAGASSWRSALRALPSLSLALEPGDLHDPVRGIYARPTERGVAWERAVSAEWLPPPGSAEAPFQIDAGLRVAGNASRKHVSTPKKSFSLRFTRRHGPAKLEYPLFAGSRVSRFDVLRLRAVFNDSMLYVPDRAQYMRDRWARETQAAMGMLAARGRFAHVYLNGLYWGVYDVSEEPTSDFVAAHRGGDPDLWDVVKPTAGGEDGIEDGTRAAFDALLAARDKPGNAGLREIHRLLDVDAYIDFSLLQMFVGNAEFGDNWRAARRRDAPDGDGFVFFVWDFENVLDLLSPRHRFHDAKVRVDVADSYGVGGLHGRLRQDPNYRLRFADRAERHLAASGALSAARSMARYRALAARLDLPIIAESARWGDHPPSALALTHGAEIWEDFWRMAGVGAPVTRDGVWRPEVERVVAFLAERPATVRSQLCREGLYPAVVTPRIEAEPNAEPEPHRLPTAVRVLPGDPARSCPNARSGIAWYTVDGSDPRMPDGSFSSSARPAEGKITMPVGSGMVRVRARARAGATWSAQVEARFGIPDVRISEIHYHPSDGDGDGDGAGSTEFLELHNYEPLAIDLSGWRVRGIGLTFPAGVTIGAHDYVVVARNPGALQRFAGLDRTPLAYPGSLSNSGERLSLESAKGHVVHAVRYRDDGAWPRAADGEGPSLVRESGASAGTADDPETWRGSASFGGSPGHPDPQQPPLVVINELLADASPARQGIELLNLGRTTADLRGWQLRDARTNGATAVLPAFLRLQPGERMVIGGPALNAEGAGGAGDQASPILDERGGTVLLVPRGASGPTGDVRGATYGPQAPNVSWGRHRSAAGSHFSALRDITMGGEPPAGLPRESFRGGAPNAAPLPGSAAIAEIQIRPAYEADPRADEFIELRNLGEDTLALAPGPAGGGGETWAFISGVQLRFPPGALIASRGRLVVTGGDPAAFRARHNVPRSVPVVGPWSGRLADEGERVVLARTRPDASPGAALHDSSAWIIVDELEYSDRAPWPVSEGVGLPAGGAMAFERVEMLRFGSDPAAWTATGDRLSPGRPPAPAP